MNTDYQVGDIISIEGEEAKVNGRVEFVNEENNHNIWIYRFLYTKMGWKDVWGLTRMQTDTCFLIPKNKIMLFFTDFGKVWKPEK